MLKFLSHESDEIAKIIMQTFKYVLAISARLLCAKNKYNVNFETTVLHN